MQKSKFFIGICPPHLIEKRIHGVKEELYQKYGIKGAFRSIAHITLQMPFVLSTKKLDLLIYDLENILADQNPFKIDLQDFDVFEPRVVFIDVLENAQLNSLQQLVEKAMRRFQVFDGTHKSRGFNPHITIAFRDLKKPTFYKIWGEMKAKTFKETFLAESVIIFKHNGSSWDVYKEIKIGNS